MTFMRHFYLKMGQLFGNAGVLSSKLARTARKWVAACIEPEVIANNFASYFSEIYAPNNAQRASSLYDEYMTLQLHENYFGFPLSTEYVGFDTELVSKVITDLKCGKAPDINELTAEHLITSCTSYPARHFQ